MNVRPAISADIIAALARATDNFGFELRVGRLLREHHNADVRHADTYIDHRTGEQREFDYQFTIKNEWRRLQLAIECKRFILDSPAVVYGHRRVFAESYHDLVFAGRGTLHSQDRRVFANGSVSEVVRVGPASDIYPVSDPTRNFVGKGVFKAMPPKDPKQGSPPLCGYSIAKDGEDYDRWNQALGSAGAMALTSLEAERYLKPQESAVTLTLPVFALPDGALWKIEFDEDGEIVGAPEQVNHCCVYRAHSVRRDVGSVHHRSVTLSHIEFVTQTGLRQYLGRLKPHDLFWTTAFPEDRLKDVMGRFRA